jgi:hypothetical protein
MDETSNNPATAKKTYAVIGASSFAAIAEMAGGADRANVNIKWSVTLFALAMVFSLYTYTIVAMKGEFVPLSAIKSRLHNNFNLIAVFITWLTYVGAIASLLNYFTSASLIAFMIALAVVVIAAPRIR